MDIDNLTIKQARELASIFGSGTEELKPLEQKRVVLVVDRGWIFAGNQSRTSDGYVRLDDAVHVFRWETIGFAKMLTEWKDSRVDLRSCDAVEVPEDAIVFRVPVGPDWGKR